MNEIEIPTKYNPKETEEKWYRVWEEKGYFHARVNPEKKPYTVVIPPPNITGVLHMGHALNNTIQDIYVRYKRMQGFEALWMPGTDHAGIATQNVVEKKLRAEGKSRDSMGREEFLKEVWKWRDEYGSTIVNQLKRLGCSCDWARTRFTMDEGLSSAVLEVFIKLYKKGLIYRGDYIINWCPGCRTALSDEEAQHREVDGMLYYIKYPIGIASAPSAPRNDEKSDRYVVIATTRPETMLGDVAVCVNPADKRYKHLDGKNVILPILNRELRVIFDKKVDPKFGTGVLKVTPAHDPVDFELGCAHKLKPINVMNEDATINAAGARFKGMDRFEAREAIVDELKERDLFIKSEPHKHAVGHCYRCHTMVEPRLSKQWFVRMAPLAKPALHAVKEGKLKFYPKRWTKVYTNWMENIRDWCISRQIWWGHRIPVYYCKVCYESEKRKAKSEKQGTKNEKQGVIVSKIKPERCPECGSTKIEQDPDVLDTWFSSWLWPFSTLGWPEKTKELEYFYPTDTLVTAQEIIFFWVSRMIMAGIEFMKEAPFRDVYIHGTVRDDTGTKMSKSLGNTIDPIDIINQFGSDALRFSVISITAQGQDVFLSPQKFEIGRNFANKLWNASRFVLMNLKEDLINPAPARRGGVKVDLCQMAKDPRPVRHTVSNGASLTLADRWILSRFYQAMEDFSKFIDLHRINDAAGRIYEFMWHEFCDWYLEIAKLSVNEAHTQIILYKVLEKSLRIMHPIIPFITEDIWQRLPREHGTDSIMISKWPHMQKEFISKKIDSEMSALINIIQAIRNLRTTWRIEPKKMVDVVIKAKKESVILSLNKNIVYIKALARVGGLELSTRAKKPPHSALSVVGDTEIFLPLEGVIDIKKESGRLNEKITGLKRELKNIGAKLKNKGFISKAPKAVIHKAEERAKSLKQEIKPLKKNLKLL